MYVSHANNVSIHEGTLKTNPDFILHNIDEYMATLLQHVCDEPDSFQRVELADL